MAPRSYIRYGQLRRTDKVDVDASDAPYALGRYFEAECPNTTDIDDCVSVTGVNLAGQRQVDKVDPRNLTTMPIVGIVVEKKNATTCLVQISGEVSLSQMLVPGKTYFVGNDGLPSSVLPTALVGGVVAVQPIGTALDEDTLLLIPNMNMIVRRND